MRTITDIALENYGSIDFVGRTCYENNLSVNENTPIDIISDTEGLGDETIKDYYRLNDIEPDNNKPTYYPLQFQTNEASTYWLIITTWDNSSYTVYTDGIQPQEISSGGRYTRTLDGKNRILNVLVNANKIRKINTYGGIQFLDVDGVLNLSRCNRLESLDISEGSLNILKYSNFFEEVDFLRIEDVNLKEFDFAGINRFTDSTTIILRNNAMTAEQVNAILISLDSYDYVNVGNFQVDGTNAAPTGSGVTAKTSLQTKGWTIITN